MKVFIVHGIHLHAMDTIVSSIEFIVYREEGTSWSSRVLPGVLPVTLVSCLIPWCLACYPGVLPVTLVSCLLLWSSSYDMFTIMVLVPNNLYNFSWPQCCTPSRSQTPLKTFPKTIKTLLFLEHLGHVVSTAFFFSQLWFFSQKVQWPHFQSSTKWDSE